MKKNELRHLAETHHFKVIFLSKEITLQCKQCHFKRELYNEAVKKTDEIADFARHSRWHIDNPNKDYAEFEKEQLQNMFKRLRF